MSGHVDIAAAELYARVYGAVYARESQRDCGVHEISRRLAEQAATEAVVSWRNAMTNAVPRETP